jgi:hypothetical protein
MSLKMAHKVILPPKKNYIPQFLKQRDINSYYGPGCYLMHLTDRCRFLNCPIRMGGGGVEGFIMNSVRRYFWGKGGGERCIMNHNGLPGDRNRCVMINNAPFPSPPPPPPPLLFSPSNSPPSHPSTPFILPHRLLTLLL